MGRSPGVEVLPFAAADAASAVLLYRLAQVYASSQVRLFAVYARLKQVILKLWASLPWQALSQLTPRGQAGRPPPPAAGRSTPWACALLYLWNPCAVATCVGCASTRRARLGHRLPADAFATGDAGRAWRQLLYSQVWPACGACSCGPVRILKPAHYTVRHTVVAQLCWPLVRDALHWLRWRWCWLRPLRFILSFWCEQRHT